MDVDAITTCCPLADLSEIPKEHNQPELGCFPLLGKGGVWGGYVWGLIPSARYDAPGDRIIVIDLKTLEISHTINLPIGPLNIPLYMMEKSSLENRIDYM